MNKIRPQSRSKASEVAGTPKRSRPAVSSAAKPATPAPKKATTIAKPQTAKALAPAAKGLPAKAAVRKSPANSATRKTTAPSGAPKVAIKGSIKAESRTKKEDVIQKQPSKKPKLRRDSFTFPEADYAMFKVLKQRAQEAGRKAKKSELVRAGMAALTLMSGIELAKALSRVESVKEGRAKKK